MSETIDALISRLREPEDDVRPFLEALIQIGAPAVDPLIAALADSDFDLRVNAIEALGEIGDARAVEPLLQALKVDAICISAAVALCRVGDERGLDPLTNALADRNVFVRVNAVEALGQIGRANTIEPLIYALRDTAAEIRDSAVAALVRLGQPAVLPLIGALGNQHPSVRSCAARALSQIGDVGCVHWLVNALSDTDIMVRKDAGLALGALGDADSLPRKILLHSAMSLPERVAALNALSAHGQYFRSGGWNSDGSFHRYRTPNARRYCERMAVEGSTEVRAAAADLLRFLAGDTLLRPSQRDDRADSATLLRAASGLQSAGSREELLRAAETQDPLENQ